MPDLSEQRSEGADQLVDVHAKALATQLIVARMLAHEAIARHATDPNFLDDEEAAILASIGTSPAEDEAAEFVARTKAEVAKALGIARLLTSES